MKYFKAFTLIGVMASFIALSSCGSDDGVDVPDATETIWEIVEGRDNLSLLESELLAVGLDANLKADGELTLFAPTNAALNTLLGTLGLEDFSTVSDEIATAVLAYHVHAGTILESDLTEGSSFSTLQGESFSILDGAIKSGATTNATFQVTDIAATNGTVHIIEVVMVPPTIGAAIIATLNTLAQPILLGANFSILADAIAIADEGKAQEETILGALIGLTDLTVFAPTNATFYTAAGVEFDDDGNITDDQATIDAKVEGLLDSKTAAEWNALIRNHVVAGGANYGNPDVTTIAPADLVTCEEFTTLGAGTLTIFNNTDVVAAKNGIGVFIDSNGDVICDYLTDGGASLVNLDAEVALPDAVNITTQGRIHVIAGILDPTPPEN